MSEELQKKRTVCFTGHRAIKKEELPTLAARLDVVIERCVSKGFTRFLSGGAVGFDILAAKRVLEAKRRFPDIELALILPCRDQTKMWKSLPDINEYRSLKENADEIVYIQDFYDSKCMMKRNCFMVEGSSLCIAYFGGRSGGTKNTVEYAKRLEVPVLNLYTE